MFKVRELLHSDLYRPLPIEGPYYKKYIVVLTNDLLRFIITRGITANSEAAEALQ